MASFRRGVITEIVEERRGLVRAHAATARDGTEEVVEAVGYPEMLGPLTPGDTVVLNTTGIDLRLGTGGVAFILWNLDGSWEGDRGAGHIVKMRYTPWQASVLAAEEAESPHHDMLVHARSLGGVPVVACSLHSQIAGAVAGIKALAPRARVGYLMTDGGGVPLAWSNLVHRLLSEALIDVTCTAGHSFGGDLEAVNVFSGLVALRLAGRADVIVVAMGPGIVGTDTALGHTAMEQGQALDAATALEGSSVACLRIAFADERTRHAGVSHHTLTALGIGAQRKTTLALPTLDADAEELVMTQLQDAGLLGRHDLTRADGTHGPRLLRERGITPTSMGRSMDDVPELFLAASAAGEVAAARLRQGGS